MRENIILKCTECGEENYINTKTKLKYYQNGAKYIVLLTLVCIHWQKI